MAASLTKMLNSAGVSLRDGQAVVWPAGVVAVAVALVSWAIGSKRGDVRVDVALASMAAFLFGVFLAFTIARTPSGWCWFRTSSPGTTRPCCRFTR